MVIGLMFLPAITKQQKIRKYSTTKLTPTEASLKKNEGFIYNNLLGKRKKTNPKIQVNHLVRTTDLKRTFSKGNTTYSSYKMHEIKEIFNETKPNYKIVNSKERYNEFLLEKTNLTLNENDSVIKKTNLHSIEHSLSIAAFAYY